MNKHDKLQPLDNKVRSSRESKNLSLSVKDVEYTHNTPKNVSQPYCYDSAVYDFNLTNITDVHYSHFRHFENHYS